MSLEITENFDQPYYTATASLPSSFSPSVIGIDGTAYLIDTRSGAYKREGFDVVQQRNTNDQRDVLLLPQDVWRQQVQSWHLGAGQHNLDRDDALIYRYDESFGIDPWTRWECKLLPSTQRMHSYTEPLWLTTYQDYLAVVTGSRIDWYDSVSASAPVGSTSVNAGHPVIDIANMGAYVTTLHNDGKVYETAGPLATPTLKGTYTSANFIAYEKDYLIAGIDNHLRDITGGGAGNLIYTSPLPNFRWVSAASGNSCIYVLGGSGDKYVVHRVSISQDGTGLTPAIVAATLPDGEIGYCIEQYLGFVLIGTNKGVRIAQENNNYGDLTLGPVIPTTEPVKCFEGQDRFVWFGNDAIKSTYSATDPYFPVGTVPGLSRLDLSVTTTTSLTPAYATDLAAIDVEGPVGVKSVVTFQNKRVFAVDGVGVYAETDDKVEAGWITQGVMSFSVEDTKTALYMQSKSDPLHGEIDLDISYDSTGFVRVVALKQQGTIRSGNISLNGTQFSRVQPRYVLRRDSSNAAVGPVFTRWEIRSIPAKGKSSRWTLPVMNYEELEIDGVTLVRDPLAVLEGLMSLYENGKLFVLQESNRAFLVHAKDFDWRPEKLTQNGRAWQGVFTLVVEEVQ